MMDVAGSVTFGTVLIAVLLIWAKAARSSQDLPLNLDLLSGESDPCGEEFVSRIFSAEDLTFINATNSKLLQTFFRRERKAVALLWVRQTSAKIRQIIREHTRRARHSENLHFQTELVIFFQYARLRFFCGSLFVLVALGGPIWVRGLALRAESLFQRFAQTRDSFNAASVARQFRSADSL